jgi:hypothetical protein
MATPERWLEEIQAAGHSIPSGENVVAKQFDSMGRPIYVTNAGNVYAPYGGFAGSYSELAPEQRQGQRSFTGVEVGRDGGYTLLGNDGTRYAFDQGYNQQRGRSVGYDPTNDPAYLAFSAQLGLTEEQAAAMADVTRQRLTQNLRQTEERTRDSYARQGDSLTGSLAQRGILDSSVARDRRGDLSRWRDQTIGDATLSTTRGIEDTDRSLSNLRNANRVGLAAKAEEVRSNKIATTTQTAASQAANDMNAYSQARMLAMQREQYQQPAAAQAPAPITVTMPQMPSVPATPAQTPNSRPQGSNPVRPPTAPTAARTTTKRGVI